MSTEPAAVPAELTFGAAYERLQEVAAELGADATMAPDRLIALLREGKGLERALRDHLERVEQDVRAIEDGDGAVAFRIVDGAPTTAPGPLSTPTARVSASSAPPVAPAPPAPAPAAAPAIPAPPQAPTPDREPEPAAAPPAPPTLGFPGADDDIPF